MIEFPTGLNSQTPADNSQMLCADGGNVAGKFTLSALWTWINNKISAIFASDVTFGDNIIVSGDVNSTGVVTSVITADSIDVNGVIVNQDLIVTKELTVGLHDPIEIQTEGDAYGEVLANSAKLEFWNNLGGDGKGTEVQVLPYYDENAADDNKQVGITIIITNKESNTPYRFDITAKKLADLLALV